MNSTYYLYRHIRPDTNQVFYVGIGKEGSKTYNRSIDKRRNSIWKDIVAENNGKYKVQVVFENLTHTEALNKEKEFISLYKRILDGGSLSNICEFGIGSPEGYMTEEMKFKLAERMKGNTYAKNAIWTEERRSQRSILSKNRKNNLGKNWSTETRQKMSVAHLGNKSTKGMMWITNGILNRMIFKDTVIPENWTKGKIHIKHKSNLNLN